MKDNKFWWGDGEKKTLVPLVGMQTGTAIMENSMVVPQKLKLELLVGQRSHYYVAIQSNETDYFEKIHVPLCLWLHYLQ
jgi:hypothetical protein